MSFLSDVLDVPDDEDDACMDGVNSVIQGSCTCMCFAGVGWAS